MLGQGLVSSDHGHRQGGALELLARVDAGVYRSVFQVKWQATASFDPGGVPTDHLHAEPPLHNLLTPQLADTTI